MTEKTGERLAISVSEAARRLGLSRSSAYRAVDRGELPVIRLGRHRILVPVRALERLVGIENQE